MSTPLEPQATDPGPAPKASGAEPRYIPESEVNALIEKARQQEKDKLYPTISKADERSQAMEAELKELRKFQKKQEADEAARTKAVDDAKRAQEEAELSAKDLLAKRDQEFNDRLEALQRENELRVATMEQEVKFNQLQAYIQRRAMEESSNIVPELVDFISGNNPEEVEASIEILKTKSAAIADAARGARSAQLRQQPGVAPVSGANGVTPLDQPGDRQVTAEDIRGMSMQDFAALRKKINMPSGSGRGLFD
jgi:hypothetical protein